MGAVDWIFSEKRSTIKGKDRMTKFHIGQNVCLASNPDLIFQITQINLDRSIQIQVLCSGLSHLKYDNVSPEMLRKVAD